MITPLFVYAQTPFVIKKKDLPQILQQQALQYKIILFLLVLAGNFLPFIPFFMQKYVFNGQFTSTEALSNYNFTPHIIYGLIGIFILVSILTLLPLFNQKKIEKLEQSQEELITVVPSLYSVWPLLIALSYTLLSMVLMASTITIFD